MSVKHAYGLAVLAIAFAAAVSPANAQQLYKGTINLPSETRWGNAVLEPGLHTIVIGGDSNGAPMIHVFEHGKDMRILTGWVEPKSGPAGSRLRLVRTRGSFQVSRLDVEALGKSFNFVVPKEKRSKGEREARSGTSVSISATT
ncbi:MAG: hypothetical protein M3Z32_12225 [Acidobacteriota bacterium]|nr:hypothetical protein [Acidobacteriota bacterium]